MRYRVRFELWKNGQLIQAHNLLRPVPGSAHLAEKLQDYLDGLPKHIGETFEIRTVVEVIPCDPPTLGPSEYADAIAE